MSSSSTENIDSQCEENFASNENTNIDKFSSVSFSHQKSKSFLKLSLCEKKAVLSPISEITLHLNGTKIGTSHRPDGEFEAELIDGQDNITDENRQQVDSENNAEYDENSGLISNNFTLNSGGRNIAERRAEIRARGIQRRLNVAPLPLDFIDDLNESLGKENGLAIMDEEFLYETENRSPRRMQQLSPGMDLGLRSPEGSPQRLTVIDNTVILEKRNSVDEIDGCSMDSGYGTSLFKFAEPRPKRSEASPSRNRTDILQEYPQNKTPPKSFRIFHSLSSGSMESMEDDDLDLFVMDSDEPNNHLFSSLNVLISGQIKKTPELKRPMVRRCLSLNLPENNNLLQKARSALFESRTPEMKRMKENLSTTPFSSRDTTSLERCFKRPEPPTYSPSQCKRYKSELSKDKENDQTQLMKATSGPAVARPIFRKSMSLNDAEIMTALARSSSEPDLIGDFSKAFCLPLVDGKHRDLKSISCGTMAKLLNGDYDDSVASYKIIDCRYPYEYEGGHIRGAANLYTHDQILEELVNSKTEPPSVQSEAPKRHILVFHCEFSSERGPKLSRFLRNHDRGRNPNTYPALQYPEIYLLHGGYKEFFENYSELCDPIAYRPMLDPSFLSAYKQCRTKTKSWSGDIKASASRSGKPKARFVLL